MYKSKKPYLYGTGCRKSSVARVHLFPNGTGAITINGRSYQIDRVLDIRRAASLKAGGVGRRYTCRICGKERYLWLEDDGKWFVESKEGQI